MGNKKLKLEAEFEDKLWEEAVTNANIVVLGPVAKQDEFPPLSGPVNPAGSSRVMSANEEDSKSSRSSTESSSTYQQVPGKVKRKL